MKAVENVIQAAISNLQRYKLIQVEKRVWTIYYLASAFHPKFKLFW